MPTVESSPVVTKYTDDSGATVTLSAKYPRTVTLTYSTSWNATTEETDLKMTLKAGDATSTTAWVMIGADIPFHNTTYKVDRDGFSAGETIWTKTNSYAASTSAITRTFSVNGKVGSRSANTYIGDQTVTIPIRKWKVTYKNNGIGSQSDTAYKIYKKDLGARAYFNNVTGYKVSFNANGGSSTPSAITQTHKQTSWNDAADGSGTKKTKGQAITSNKAHTFYAQWNSAITLPAAISRSNSTSTATVTFDANSGTCSTKSLSSTKTTKYTFSKWAEGSTSGTKYSAGASYTPKKAVTMYATWSTSGSFSTITLPTPSREGHTFNGWYTAKSGGTKVGNAGASYTPSATVTLYAQWSVVKYTNTIRHYQQRAANHDDANQNGWKYIESTTFTANYGSTVTIPPGHVKTYPGHYNTGFANSSAWNWSRKDIGTTFTQPANGISIDYYYNGYSLTVKYKTGKVDIGTLEGTSLTANQLAGTEVFHEQSETYGNNFGGTSGLANYNNSDFIYLRKYGFRVPSGSEWKNGTYICTQNGTFTTEQIAEKLGVSINSSNKTVIVEPNWQANNLVKIYNGSAWVDAVPMIFNGSNWVETIPYVYKNDTDKWKQCK